MIEERQAEFLLNPLKNRIWAVLMPDGELLDDVVSVKRARFCVESNEVYWVNPFGGAYHWTIKSSKPYEEEFYRFKKEAQQYMCVFNLSVSDLQYIDLSPISGELIFDEEELSKKLSGKDYTDFKNFMLELWDYIKED